MRRLLLRFFRLPDIDYQQLFPISASALKWDARIKYLVDGCRSANRRKLMRRIQEEVICHALNDELFHAVLRKTVVKDLDLEFFLTALRSCYLELATDPAFEIDLERHGDIMASLASQCFRTEYIYRVEPQEEERLDQLAQELRKIVAAGAVEIVDPKALVRLSVYGMYKPFWTLEPVRKILDFNWHGRAPSLYELVDEQIRTHLEEIEIRDEIPSLGMSDNKISQAVRNQYEEYPYPRWFSITIKKPKPFPETMRSWFPHLRLADVKGPTEILIAGCGTGRHALYIANAYSNANIIAIDISKASLAYAIRKTREYGISNIRFYQADILCLKDLDKRFHLIEAVGVLHHMEDPMAGWRVLSDLLLPGGFLRIGLYSRLARQCLNPARELVREKRSGNQPAALRSIRQEIIATEQSRSLKGAANFSDFFVLSEFRDLLFHEREIDFTLPEIAAVLEDLGLRFVGFEFSNGAADVKKRFQMLYPEEHQSRDLRLWDSFERAHPDAFSSIYLFWAQKGEES